MITDFDEIIMKDEYKDFLLNIIINNGKCDYSCLRPSSKACILGDYMRCITASPIKTHTLIKDKHRIRKFSAVTKYIELYGEEDLFEHML